MSDRSDVVIRCPRCGESASLAADRCESCGDEIPHQAGIPSFIDDAPEPTGIDGDHLDRLLEELERDSLHRSIETVLEFDGGHAIVDEVCAPGDEHWRILLPEAVRGRCLDVDAGFGTRSLLLAELASTVCAVDTRLDALRVLDMRDDYDSRDAVVPVHADPLELPFPDGSFDTIVATAADRHRRRTRWEMEALLDSLASLLAPEGTLVYGFDAWPRTLGVTRAIGVEGTHSRGPGSPPSQPSTPMGRLRRSTRAHHLSLLRSAGLEPVSQLALVPTADLPRYVFDVEDVGVLEFVADAWGSLGPLDGRLLARLVPRRLGVAVLERAVPSALLVCRKGSVDARAGSHGRRTERLLVGGRTRSVVLEVEDGSLARVRKVANRRLHEPFVTREVEVVSSLATDERLAATLPEGRLERTRLGTTYVEEPVSGTTAAAALDGDLETFATVLHAGFDWIARLQRLNADERVTLSPAAVARELACPTAHVDPPVGSSPIETFRTPCHGDFEPQNVYVDDGRVTTVIDWEYAGASGRPVTDPGHFAARLAAIAFGGYEEGLRNAFMTETPHASVVRDAVHEYCDAVGIDPSSFPRYLPHVWIRKNALEEESAVRYTSKAKERGKRVSFVWRNLPEIERTLDVR